MTSTALAFRNVVRTVAHCTGSRGFVAAAALLACAVAQGQGAGPGPAPTSTAAPAAAASTAAPTATAAPAKAAPKRAPRKPLADAASVDPTVKSDTKAGKNSRAMDRLDLDTTQITGNRELPKVMVVVPWKKSDIGDLVGKPVNSLVDEALEPVDREVFRREVDYYGALSPDRPTSAGPSSGGPAVPAARSETGVTPDAGSPRPEK
jgi:hypothetical protein